MGAVIFVDTSAFVAILKKESDATELAETLEKAERRLTSSAVRLETCMVLSRLSDITAQRAQEFFDLFLAKAKIEEIAVEPKAGRTAVDCFQAFGKGRHPAKLNFGDCLSYACAKDAGARLLYKGDDFSQTDIND